MRIANEPLVVEINFRLVKATGPYKVPSISSIFSFLSKEK